MDATGIVTAATFRDAEDAAGYLEIFRRTIARHGRPLAVYSDQHGIFIKDPNRPPTLAEQLAGKRSFTQVGRALDEAGIGWIPASSPQAGRTVTLEERLDGSLWVGADGCHQRLVEAPSVAPLLRARKLERIEPLLPAPERTIPVASPPSAASTAARPIHPWQRYPAVRPR